MTMHDSGALPAPPQSLPRPSAPSVSTRPFVVMGYIVFFFGALPLLLWTIGGRVDAMLRLPRIEAATLLTVGGHLAAGGAALLVWSMVTLWRAGQGLPISHLPPTRLVARGPYTHMRHPIYVGFATAFAGLGMVTGSIGRCTFATLLLVIGSSVYAIGFEEPRLLRRFGAAYQDYAQRVPAFPCPRALTNSMVAIWRWLRPAIERVANRVVLFRLGPTIWVTYGSFAGAGAALGLGVCHALMNGHVPFRQEALYLLGLTVVTLLGARVVALLYQPRLLFRSPWSALRRVGFVSWGGYIGLLAAPFALASLTGKNPWWLLDRTLIAGLVCSAVGRMGCLAYGCCYGRPSDEGICWHHDEAKVNRERPLASRVRRVPTQLMSTASALVLAPIALLVMDRAASGVAAILTALLYCVTRFGIECLRDEPRFFRLGLTRGQIVSGAAAGSSIALLLTFPVAPASRTAFDVATGSTAGGPGGLVEGAVVVSAAAIVFIACSVHWNRVGRW